MRFYLSDCHTDFLTEIKNKSDREIYVKETALSGVKIMCCAVFTTHNKIGLNEIKEFKKELNYLSKKYRIKLLLTIEDVNFVNNLHDLYELISLKPFSVTLTWNFKNKFAGGANTNFGLTKFGKKAIKIFEENNIFIDVAHLSKKAFNEFLSITKFPVFCSHANIENFKFHKRNLCNLQLKNLVNSNGFLGLTIYDKFISNTQISSTDIALQFDCLIKQFGENNFGFGTDLYGIDFKHTPVDISCYADLQKVANALLDFGYSTSVVEKIMYKNFFNFIKKHKVT